ncbi:MAG TPA: aminotransferase class I/II-fold pyridoxal phosphate-dependent enzyme [Cytophagaceae bacterium]|jgi:O-succinylhomoserine sulfhydrylase|nr:aminotransferase class I/II-fold pyridoxal phosphate-dependent enzyme [Cytophagaceae bacterium]
MNKDKKIETIAIRTQTGRTQYNEHSTPLFMTSSFVFDNAEHARALFADEVQGDIYTRFSNPNNSEFIEKICKMEGAEDGFAVSSGMSAVFTSMASFLKSGDHVLVSKSVFGSTIQILTNIFPRWGITHTFADIGKPETWEGLIKENTKLIMVETPSNPALDLIDLEWLGKLAQKYNLLLDVDNCFATPYLQNPIKWGAHVVTHSATKFIDGQGRAIGGIIVGKKELIKEVRFFGRHTGPALSPFNSWLLSKSLETLAVRMDRHCENALKLAQFLEQHPDIEKVKYPFLPSHPQFELARKQMKAGGGIVTFLVKGGIERGRKFLDATEMASHSANLGDSRTIVTHPASTTHSKLTEEDRQSVGILPGLIRISVGLEHIDDIIEEISQALQKSK